MTTIAECVLRPMWLPGVWAGRCLDTEMFGLDRDSTGPSPTVWQLICCRSGVADLLLYLAMIHDNKEERAAAGK